MIIRVDIDNLVIVEHASFEPGPTLTSVTGETGAGKTLLAGAISLLFGGDAQASQVGSAASHAYVEGEFEPNDAFWRHPSVATLAELRPEPDAPLVLARKIEASGRSRALAWGRTVTKADLAAAGRLLVAFASQHAQRRLLQPAFQRAAVDDAGDEHHQALLASMAAAYADEQQVRVRVQQLQHDVEQSAAELDQLRDDLGRLDALQPSVEDYADVLARRDAARHHAELLAALAGALAALDGGESSIASAGVADLLGAAYDQLEQASSIQAAHGDVAAQVLSLQQEVGDIVTYVSSAIDALADGPASIDDLEERLSAYDEAKRRHGGTVESVVLAWQQLRDRLAHVDGADDALALARDDLRAARERANEISERLRASRCAIAERLQTQISEHLAELGMAGNVFRIHVTDGDRAAHGSDRVELRIAPSDEIEPRPIAEVASGGELSRIALALLVASGVREADTILFDEIDAGIGGHTAHAIASLLRRLADDVQIICITHLPQVAARASRHVVIDKVAAKTTLTTLADERQVVDELCRMLGADPADPAARQHATGLRGPRISSQATMSLLD